MIDDLKNENWTFTYIGADHDVENFALNISITNSMRFHKNEDDMKKMFESEKTSRANYSRKIRDKEDTTEGYFEEPK